MKMLFRWLQREQFLFWHSPLPLFHLLVPVLGIAVFAAYYTVSPWSEPQKVSAYLQAVAMLFPLFISAATAMGSEREAQAGGFQQMLHVSGSKFSPHLAKLLVFLLYGFLSSMAAVLGFGLVFRCMGNVGFSAAFYAQAACLLFLGNCVLYFLQYLAAFAFGKGMGLGLGIAGSLVSALLLTGLGDGTWPYLPWGTGMRLSVLWVARGGSDFFARLDVQTAFCIMIAQSLLLLAATLVWSVRWEGRKCEET